jgi:hypothetical protein
MLKRKKSNPGLVGTARPTEPTGKETYLGTFGSDPIVFTVYEAESEQAEGVEYRVYGDDGPGPRLVCWFTPDPEEAPVWRGAWNGDRTCGRIEARTREIIANPQAEGVS